MIKELTKYIEDNTSLKIGTTLFAGIPDSTTGKCSIVSATVGGSVDFYLPDKTTKAVQIVSRAADYWEAYNESHKICSVLHRLVAVDLPKVENDYHVLTSEVVSDPYYMGQDNKGNHEFSFNVLLRFIKKQED